MTDPLYDSDGNARGCIPLLLAIGVAVTVLIIALAVRVV